MLISWVVVLIAIAGVLIFALSTNAKVARIGEIMFLCGLMATCFMLVGKTVRLL